MKVLGVVEIQRGQQREDIGLNSRDEEFEGTDGDHQQEAGQANDRSPQHPGVAAGDDEARQHFKQHVSGHHRHEQSQREAERAHQERDQLDRRDQPHQPQRRAVRDEQRKEVQNKSILEIVVAPLEKRTWRTVYEECGFTETRFFEIDVKRIQ